MVTFTDQVRPAAVAGAFYPEDPDELGQLIDRQLSYGRALLESQEQELQLPSGVPKAVIVPHAGYEYSGTTAALAYALLERGRGVIRKAVIVGPTHRVPVHGVAMSTAGRFATPLGLAKVDQDVEKAALEGGLAQSLIVNDLTHAQEHAVEVQIPWLQTVLGSDISIVPLNVGDCDSEQVGDVLRGLWGGPETVIVISSDLSHYHPESVARTLDDETVTAIASLGTSLPPDRACGAYPINGLLDVCRNGVRGAGTHNKHGGNENGENPDILTLRFLGCSTSGDNGEVTLADGTSIAASGTGAPAHRPSMAGAMERVVGYAAFAVWERGSCEKPENAVHGIKSSDYDDSADREDHGAVLLALARAALCIDLGIDDEADSALYTTSDSARNGGADNGVDPRHDPVRPLADDPWYQHDGTALLVERFCGWHPWLKRPAQAS